MIMKALFDLSLNDRIELILLDRKIAAYWERKARDEQQKKKMVEAQNNLVLHHLFTLNLNHNREWLGKKKRILSVQNF